MVFKKKPKPKPDELKTAQEILAETTDTEILDATTAFNGEVPDELPDLPEPKKVQVELPLHLKVAVDQLMKYQGAYSFHDFQPPVIDVEMLNISFGMFAEISKQTNIMAQIVLELQGLRQDIKSINE